MVLSVVIVTHDSAAWLGAFASTWAAACHAAAGERMPMAIVDSGSADNTRQCAIELFPQATHITCGNIGYGAAANRGVDAMQSDWILVCNADLTFPEDFVQRILGIVQMADARTACVAPRLLNADGTRQPSVGRFPTLAGIVVDQFRARSRRKYTFPQPGTASPIDWASGACLLLRREAFLAVGGFDGKFFLYAEEVDLHKRLHLAGWRVMFAPELAITHHQPNAGRTPRLEIQRYAARGLLRYFAKHAGFVALWGYRKLAFLSGRLSFAEAFASRRRILERPTGP